MKDKVISDFEGYLQKANIKNIRVASSSTEVDITTSLLNDRMFIDIALVALAIYGTYHIDDKSFYLIPIIIAWAVLVVIIWLDFNRINNIRVDLLSKKVQVVSRNIFKKLLFKKQEYDFNEVDSFAVRSNFSSKADSKKYFVDARVRNGATVVLTFFAREEQAHYFVGFMNTLIKN